MSAWIQVSKELPPDDTPVLLYVNETVYEGILTWEKPGFEDTHQPFQYFVSADEKDHGWDWYDVSHWMQLPEPPPENELYPQPDEETIKGE